MAEFIVMLKRWREEHLRLVPGFGAVREQAEAAVPLPQHQGVLKRKWRYLMATFSISDSEQSTFTIQAVDRRGNPTQLLPGSVTWLVDNVALLALMPASDGMSCLVAAVGPLGTATVSVKVTDAANTTLAAGQIDVIVHGGAAARIDIQPGAITEQS